MQWFCISKISIIQGIPIPSFKLFPAQESSKELQFQIKEQNEATTLRTNDLNDKSCNTSISDSKGCSVSECYLLYGYNYLFRIFLSHISK